MEMTKFRGTGQILQLSSKFRGPRKTVGPSDLGFVWLSCPLVTSSLLIIQLFHVFSWIAQ